MNDTLRGVIAPIHEGDYEVLPEFIKAALTLTEYLWLSGEEKARLVQDFTEPEV